MIKTFILEFLANVEKYNQACYHLHMAIPNEFISSFSFWLEYLNTRYSYSWILHKIFEYNPKFKQTIFDVSSNNHNTFHSNATKALEYLISASEKDQLEKYLAKTHKRASDSKKI